MGSSDTEASVDPELTLAGAPSELDTDPHTEPGATIGRYVVVGVVGQGAMGRVLRAYDPKLRREVALKIVRSRTSSRKAEARLLREAHALARLSHPNVVAVYDAEATERGVAIAMEYVEGSSLRAWLAKERRTWRDVVEVGVAIASGLAAAHAAGLVHRDVKPDNVLVGSDASGPRGMGRVRVTDFGLAREHGGEWVAPSGASQSDLADGDPTLTEEGTIVGTPAYMAPEQHAGAVADARADQYALCVLLFEALHGARPFTGRNWMTLLSAKRAGPPASPPTPIPRWLHAVVTRGLAPDPEQRWSSVEELARALASGRQRRQRRALLVPVAGLAIAGLLWFEVRDADRRAAVAECEAAGTAIASSTWNEGVRASVHDALVGTGVSYAPETADKIAPWFDAHAHALHEARTEVCLDANVHHRAGWDADVLERAVWCIDERRMELAAVLTELSRGEPNTVARAIAAAAALRRVEPCRDEALLARLPAPPTADREEVEAMRGELSRVTALRITGTQVGAVEAARATLRRAEALAWPPLVAEARVALGRALEATASYREAEATLEAAYFEAANAGATEVEFDAAAGLAYVIGVRSSRFPEALRWARHSEVASAGLPDPAGLRAARYASNVGSVRMAMGSYDEATALFERALALAQDVLAPEHPDLATFTGNLAAIRQVTADYEAAKILCERALAILERAFGPDHPDVAVALLSLATAQHELGAHAEARALIERALAIRQRAFGPDHPEVARAMVDLGNQAIVTGEYDRAKELYTQALQKYERVYDPEHAEIATALTNLGGLNFMMGSLDDASAQLARAVEINEKRLGPDHPELATNLYNLAAVYHATDSLPEATALFERALAIRMRALGPDHPLVADVLSNLAIVQLASDEVDEAENSYARALAIREAALGPEHLSVVDARVGLAEVALVKGRTAEAIAMTERAIASYEAGESRVPDLAWARYLLARALTDKGEAPPRARALAEQAADAFRQLGEASSSNEIDAWIAEHD